MAKPRLDLDADTPIQLLQRALIEQGHAVTRTPNAWITQDASDDAQLLAATAQGRVIFAFNVQAYSLLARRHLQPAGIILAAQRQWTLSALIATLERALTETEADDWPSRARWLSDWRVLAGG